MVRQLLAFFAVEVCCKLSLRAVRLGPASSTTPASADNVPDFPEHHPQFDRARVKRFVIAGHANLPAVKAMLAEEPNLINGAIDWGNGDFETALGGASHMGRRDIAEYLLEHNARMDIFAATMLGQIDIVKAAVAAFPNIVNVPGPHGIPLIVHAEKGGAAAQSRVGIFAAAYHSTVAPTMMKISSGKNRTVATALVVSFVSLSFIGITRANDTAKQVARIVAQIQRADFAGDQVANATAVTMI